MNYADFKYKDLTEKGKAMRTVYICDDCGQRFANNTLFVEHEYNCPKDREPPVAVTHNRGTSLQPEPKVLK